MFDLETHIVHMRDARGEAECFFISPELGARCADVLRGALPLLGPCATLPSHLAACGGGEGGTYAYVLSRELWNEVKYDLRAAEKELFYRHGGVAREALDDFRDFLDQWDREYEYDGAVSCPHCGVETPDWRTDPGHPFSLSNANTGGLLVFQCANCGTTIRLKHFADEVVREFTLPHNAANRG